MNRTISPSTISGALTAPASKSAMQRACALALLHRGRTLIGNPGTSDDDHAAIGIIKQLGASCTKNENGSLLVTSSGFPGNASHEGPIILDCGESGLSIRMFAPIAALSVAPVTLTGKGSLLLRPMDSLEGGLPQLGVNVSTHNGRLPVNLQGPLRPANISLDGSATSQSLTGLLIALASCAKEKMEITVQGLVSRPYIDLTLRMMRLFGYSVTHDNYERFLILPSTDLPDEICFDVEGDWSGASFLMAAAAIAGTVTVRGLDIFSAQADKAFLQVLMQAGVPVSVSEKEIEVRSLPMKRYRPFQFNATDCPDLFPPAVALAAYCEGMSVIEGVSRLIHKESDRAVSLQQEFGKMGIDITIQDDLMLVTGGRPVGANIDSHHDHRIAMACAVAALGADGNTTILHAEAVNKSYPRFFDDLKMLGADVSLPVNP